MVSRYSRVNPISSIAFGPAHTTHTFVFESSSRSAEISNVFSAPLCTPPIPPVANTAIFANLAMIIVDATVVEPDNFLKTAIARSLLEIFLTLLFVA